MNMFISDDIRYVGVNDHDIDLFEGQYVVPNGMAYNSYVILDEKVAVMDAVDRRFGQEWLENVRRELDGRKPGYLVVRTTPQISPCLWTASLRLWWWPPSGHLS